jgi:nitrite reductase (cytochrome c-552)
MKRTGLYVGLIVVVALVTAGVMLLGQSVMERRAEGERAVFNVVDLDETVVDPEVWGQNFPRQFDGYQRTVDMERTRFGGSEAFDKLQDDPNLSTMFAGYGFGIEFNEERGHIYTLFDQEESARVTELDQPGSCLQCHASNTVAYYEAGVEAGAPPVTPDVGFDDPRRVEAVLKGFAIVNALPYAEANELVEHPVSCIDCHDPRTMDLRVTKPGFLIGVQELAGSEDPLPHLPSIEEWREGDRAEPYDPNALASRQEMRTMVCGQCHVEYYFKGEDKQLTYPWDRGIRADEILGYYDEVGQVDWTHAISGAGVLKAQHPEFELWNTGVHARSGVADARPRRERHGRPDRADRRRSGGRRHGRPARGGARVPADRTVVHRLRERRELDGVPFAAGGGAAPRPGPRRRTPRLHLDRRGDGEALSGGSQLTRPRSSTPRAARRG